MTYLVKPNAVSLRYANFSFMMKSNGPIKDIYILIVSNMIEFPAKGISPPIRYVLLVNYMMTNHTKLVVNSDWLPLMA